MHVNWDICRYLLIPVNIFLSVTVQVSCMVLFPLLHSMFMRMKVLMQHHQNLWKLHHWLLCEWDQDQNAHGGFPSLNSLFVTDPMRRWDRTMKPTAFLRALLIFVVLCLLGFFFPISSHAVGSNEAIIKYFQHKLSRILNYNAFEKKYLNIWPWNLLLFFFFQIPVKLKYTAVLGKWV